MTRKAAVVVVIAIAFVLALTPVCLVVLSEVRFEPASMPVMRRVAEGGVIEAQHPALSTLFSVRLLARASLPPVR
jgi:hypothetical protein